MLRQPKLERSVLKIRQLNDSFRKTFLGGRVVITRAISAWPDHVQVQVMRLVQQFDAFTPDNDPNGEHDMIFLDFDYAGYREKVIGKIDYYDKELRFGSPDPSDPAKTTRILTIMLASEW